MTEKSIIFSFSGGMADGHQLNFYEAARFQYAAARLVYTYAHFRNTGNVLQKISTKVDADIRVSAAQKGSFELEVAIAALPVLHECKIKIPLDVLFAYVINKIRGLSRGRRLAERLSDGKLRGLTAIVDNDSEETKRLALIRDISADQNDTIRESLKTTQEALSVLRAAGFDGISHLKEAPKSQLEYSAIIDDLTSEIATLKLLQPYESELENISPEKEESLFEIFKKVSRDLALPLESSAALMSIAIKSSTNKIATYDHDFLKGLSKETIDITPTSLRGSVKAYDKETGWGKFRNVELPKPLSFYVKGSAKEKNLVGITQAMQLTDVYMSFYIIRNSGRVPIRLVFNKIIRE